MNRSTVPNVSPSRRGFLAGALALGAVSAFGLQGCSSGDTQKAPNGSKSFKTRNQSITTVTSLASYARGTDYAWRVLGSDPATESYDGDMQKAISQAQLYSSLGVNMVTGYLVADSAYTQYAKTLTDQGINYWNLANAVPWRHPSEPIFKGHFLGHIQAQFADEAYLSAKALFERAGGEGEMIHLLGAAGSASDNTRSFGVQKALEEFPKIKVVASQATDWDSVKAQTVTETLVPAHPNAKIIFAQNDSIGSGAVKALRGLRSKEVLVAGVDGDPQFVQMIADGDYAVATAAAREDLVGCMTAVIMWDMLNGVEFDPLETMLRNDDVLVDTPEAAQEMIKLVPESGDLPYDVKAMSRYLQKDDWKTQIRVQAFDPFSEWSSKGSNPAPKPAGFAWPKEYGEALTPKHAAEVNKAWDDRYTDFFASVREKANYKEHVLGALGESLNYEPYTDPDV
jgi:ribose transport system substrate-binding protein